MDAIEQRLEQIEKTLRMWRSVPHVLCLLVAVFVGQEVYDTYRNHCVMMQVIESEIKKEEEWRAITEAVKRSFGMKVGGGASVGTGAASFDEDDPALKAIRILDKLDRKHDEAQ